MTKSGNDVVRNIIKAEIAKPRMSKSAKKVALEINILRTREDPSTTMPGIVNKIIPTRLNQPEKAQISIHGPERKYRDLRIENTLVDEHGDNVSLKKGAHVQVTVASKERHNNSD